MVHHERDLRSSLKGDGPDIVDPMAGAAQDAREHFAGVMVMGSVLTFDTRRRRGVGKSRRN
jgi:predicted aconitase with swiveling domain